ncbi:hypothetical protein BDV25DRAFT_137517 [Aspergillus avenaceus]|uniref:BTB domain-containing protein n=1 Tax=Aspergillus avenaceus TaxID=36643 RepID=A0A5N6U2N5_ASPAV|nr:hypothetical protein BDV25DRAFT_137517 [Aspergillus avenaceus]
MESAFGKHLSSPTFTFTVGANKKEFIVHSSALAGLSQSLNTLMNGQMTEARTGHVDWPDVDEDTFARLCEFAYCRNYTPPSFSLIEHESPLPRTPEPINEEEKHRKPDSKRASNQTSHLRKRRVISTEYLHEEFKTSLVVPSPQVSDSEYIFAPPKITGPWEDFTLVFLGQARLYVLADKYGIEPLRRLILSKLHRTLDSFTLYDTGVSGIVEFVRFVYLNTPCYGNKVDALRDLAARYVVSVLDNIGEAGCFLGLLEEGGPFVSDFWRIAWVV